MNSPFKIIIISTLFYSINYAQQSNQFITIDMVMSKIQQKETGISTLNSRQRENLEKWLINYTLNVMKISNPGSGVSNYYPGIGSGHWISKKSNNGEIITLEDGSIWKINSMDKLYTMLWLPITNITVLESRSPIGEFKYILYNTDDGEKALAKYLGK